MNPHLQLTEFFQISTVKEIMSPLLSILSEESLWSAYQQMQRSQTSALMVLNNQSEPIGLLSEQDLLSQLKASDWRSIHQPVDELIVQRLDQLQQHNLELEEQVANLRKQLQVEVAERNRLETSLQQANESLESQLKERSASWEQVTTQLLIEIAERVQVEDVLKQTNEQLQAVLDAVPGLVTWIDADLRYLGANRHAAAAFNMPAESFVGQEVGFLNSSPQFNQFVHQLFAGSEKTASDEMTSNVNGVLRTYLIVGQKYSQDQAAVCVGTDVTQLKQTEIDLRRSLQMLSDFKYALDQATILSIVDAQSMICYANDQFCKIFQYAKDEVIGQPYYSIGSGSNSKVFSEELWLAVTRDQIWRGEVQTQAKDGTCYWLDSTIAPFLDDVGQPCQYLVIQTDITDRKRVEADIQKNLEKEKQLSQLKSRFISMTSHEFRTPLAVISSSAGILKDFGHKLSEAQKEKHLTCIQNYVGHTTHLLDDILLINRVESGNLVFEPRMLNLKEFCSLLVEEMQLNAPDHAIAFSSQVEESFDPSDVEFVACVDEKLLRQILVNLLSNAMKFSDIGSAIRFDLKMQPEQVAFEVADAGIGIPIEDRPHIFESFHRGSNVDTAPGNGLGLAIVKKCLDLHGGSIMFVSEVNLGSTFVVSLPLQISQSCAGESLTAISPPNKMFHSMLD